MKNKIDLRALYVGTSITAGWAWGASLVFSLTVISERGMVPFFVWGSFNALALLVFGLIIFKFRKIFDVVDNVFIKSFNVLVRIFSLWIQMNIIQEMAVMAGIPDRYAMLLAWITGTVFVFVFWKWGLEGSMLTDQFQWYGAYVAMIILIIMGISGGEPSTIEFGSNYNIMWSVYTGFLLLSGPLVDLQNWQRAEVVYKENLKKAYVYGSILFFIYMVMIFIVAQFEFTNGMYIVLFMVAFLMATSTMDSDVVALHKAGGRNIGLIIGFVVVVSWQLVNVIGAFDLWQVIANLRFYVALIILIVTFYITMKHKKRNKGRES